jgi:hypothetical protein
MRSDEFDLLSKVLEDSSVETTTREDNSADGCLSVSLEVCVMIHQMAVDPRGCGWLWVPSTRKNPKFSQSVSIV